MGKTTSDVTTPKVQRYIMGGLFILIVATGTWLSLDARNQADRNIRGEMLRQANNVASSLSMENMRDLSFRVEDIDLAAHQRIARQLQAYSQDTETHRIYILGLRDGQLFYGPESLPPDNPKAAAPGTHHQKPPQADFDVFRTAEATAYGPYSDECGEFVSALVPVFDSRAGEVLLVLGLDMEAAVWRRKLQQAQRIPVLSTLSMLSLLLLGYLVHGVYKRSPHMRVEYLRNIAISICFSVMLLLAVIAFICVRDAEHRTQQELFRAEANAKSQYFTEAAEQIDLVLHLLIGFFEASENIDRAEFGAFCRHIFEGYPVEACYWIPELSAADVPAFTARIQAEGFPDFSIRQFADDSRPAPGAEDPIYPVVYVEPPSALPPTLGFDFYSHPVLRETLLETLRSGSDHACLVPAPTATGTEPSGFFVFVPISHPRQSGLACFSIKLDAMIKGSAPSGETQAISATLFELQAGKKPRPLSCSTCDQCDDMFGADLSARSPLFAFGNTYMMLFTAEPAWFAANPQRAAWWVLGIGLTLGLLLTYTAAVLFNRPLLLAKRVIKRTRELAESKERFDIAISAAKMGVWEYDIARDQFIWNDRMLEIYGIQDDEFDGGGTAWARYIHPADHNHFARELSTAEYAGTDFNCEYRIIRPGGETRHISALGKPIFGASGKAERVVGVNLDVTERKQAQQAVEESRQLLCNIIDSMPERVWWKDLDSRFLGCNIHVAQDAGFDHPDQVIGKTDFDMCWAVHAETFVASDREVMKSGEPRLSEPELQVMEDGSTRWIEVTMIPLKDTNGKVFGILGTYTDITERKQAEEQLTRLSAAIEQSPEAIVITDTDGKIQYINPAFTVNTGYSAGEALGENPRILKSEEHHCAFYEEMWKTLTRGKIWEGRITNRRKDGTLFTEEATISPVRDVNGTIVNYVAVKRDISGELVQEEELRQAQKMEAVGELAGGVAHDFNNILQGIIGFSELLRYTLDDTSLEYKNADEIYKAATRAAKLTQQLLTFSRKQAVRLEEIDLNNVVYDSEALLNVLLGDSYEIVLELPDELPLVYADQGQLTQIIMNLAVNARDAMPDGGRLSISTECMLVSESDAAYIAGARPGSYLCLAVTDTGAGMDGQTQSRIFDPFFTTKEVGAGTGLGLAVIYGIVQQNRGWINVYSEIGKGTCFKIYLPVAELSAENGEDPPTEEPRRNARILLIEDDPKILNMVKKVLSGADLTIIAAGNAEDGLELFDQSADEFDLLMSDMELPGMRGDQLAEALRKKDSKLPVLLFSGYRDQVNRWKQLADKEYAFLNKPFTISILLDTVRTLLKDNKGTHG